MFPKKKKILIFSKILEGPGPLGPLMATPLYFEIVKKMFLNKPECLFIVWKFEVSILDSVFVTYESVLCNYIIITQILNKLFDCM